MYKQWECVEFYNIPVIYCIHVLTSIYFVALQIHLIQYRTSFLKMCFIDVEYFTHADS